MGDLERAVEAVVDGIRREHARDARLSVFDVEVDVHDGELRVRGATSEPAAAEALHARLGTIESGFRVVDDVARLPHGVEPARSHAIVTAAIAPMLSGPDVAEVHISQALMGHRLTVLRPRGRWLQCRAEDGYIGWVHRGYVTLVDEQDARAWEGGDGGITCLALGARALDANGETRVLVPWGARVTIDDQDRMILPDGVAYDYEGDVVAEATLTERFPATGPALVTTAARWLGSPYLWGGTTPAGVDCSGLAQAVYRTHGMEIPRDSDLQARAGRDVDPGRDFHMLRPGDLLFFAESPDRITHVTISTGGPGIIHSSLGNGGVRRNDLTGDLRYERELRDLYVCARRILD